MVYWSHMYDWGYRDFIRQLIQVRRAAGVRADSAISFHSGYSGLVATVTGSQQTGGGAQFQPEQSRPVASGSFSEAVNTSNGQCGSGAPAPAVVAVTMAAVSPVPVSVNFRCDNGVTQPGDSVYAVGNVSQLGN